MRWRIRTAWSMVMALGLWADSRLLAQPYPVAPAERSKQATTAPVSPYMPTGPGTQASPLISPYMPMGPAKQTSPLVSPYMPMGPAKSSFATPQGTSQTPKASSFATTPSSGPVKTPYAPVVAPAVRPSASPEPKPMPQAPPTAAPADEVKPTSAATPGMEEADKSQSELPRNVVGMNASLPAPASRARGADGQMLITADDYARLIEYRVVLAWLADSVTCPCQLRARAGDKHVEVSGVVPSNDVKVRALQLAAQHSGKGVLDSVAILPAPQQRPRLESPERLRTLCREALEEGPGKVVFDLRLDADTGGIVKVAGTVPSVEEKLAISQRLRRVRGCTAIHNDLVLWNIADVGRSYVLVTADGSHLTPAEAISGVAASSAPAVKAPAPTTLPAAVKAPAPTVLPASVKAGTPSVLPATVPPARPVVSAAQPSARPSMFGSLLHKLTPAKSATSAMPTPVKAVSSTQPAKTVPVAQATPKPASVAKATPIATKPKVPARATVPAALAAAPTSAPTPATAVPISQHVALRPTPSPAGPVAATRDGAPRAGTASTIVSPVTSGTASSTPVASNSVRPAQKYQSASLSIPANQPASPYALSPQPSAASVASAKPAAMPTATAAAPATGPEIASPAAAVLPQAVASTPVQATPAAAASPAAPSLPSAAVANAAPAASAMPAVQNVPEPAASVPAPSVPPTVPVPAVQNTPAVAAPSVSQPAVTAPVMPVTQAGIAAPVINQPAAPVAPAVSDAIVQPAPQPSPAIAPAPEPVAQKPAVAVEDEVAFVGDPTDGWKARGGNSAEHAAPPAPASPAAATDARPAIETTKVDSSTSPATPNVQLLKPIMPPAVEQVQTGGPAPIVQTNFVDGPAAQASATVDATGALYREKPASQQTGPVTAGIVLSSSMAEPISPAAAATQMQSCLRDLVRNACGGDVSDVRLLLCSSSELEIKLQTHDAGLAQSLAERIMRLPELTPYRVMLEVRVKK